ncbi:hypothetical protein FACS1894132_13420 [Clostridia bacterium]|nr:hypothetical protein FACS1894132_13420 [Clostridia bacterium]
MNLQNLNYRKPKSLKGMTLIECIIALAIFGIMGSMLIMGVTTVLSAKKSTGERLRRTSYEAPTAENMVTQVHLRNVAGDLLYINASGGETTDEKDPTSGNANTPKVGYLRNTEPVLKNFIIYNSGYTVSGDKVYSYDMKDDPSKPIFEQVDVEVDDTDRPAYEITIFSDGTPPAGANFLREEEKEMIQYDETGLVQVGSYIETVRIYSVYHKKTIQEDGPNIKGYEQIVDLKEAQSQLNVAVDLYRVLDPHGDPNGFKYYVVNTPNPKTNIDGSLELDAEGKPVPRS